MRIETIFEAGTEIITGLARRIITAPFRLAIHRHPRQWVVIGRDDGRFVDNAKHFFCWLHTHALLTYTITFISKDIDTVARIRNYGARAMLFPSNEARYALLRTSTIIVDNDHPFRFRQQYAGWARGARLIQLWHGAPLKQIELYFYRRRLLRLGPVKRLLAKIQTALSEAYSTPDVLVSPSTFYTRNVFDICFNAKRTIQTGYPRNDCLLMPESADNELLNLNVDQQARLRMAEHRQGNGRVILYAPTYREDLSSPFDDGGIDLHAWAATARRTNSLLVLKLHPAMHGRTPTAPTNSVLHIDPYSDIYPLLRNVDLLVSDYSSIFFDFLILDRPIVFFPYDFSQYISEGRPLLFDYESMTPGPKARNFNELMELVQNAFDNGKEDQWEAERDRIRRLAFDHVDSHASERIWAQLTGERWRQA